MATMHPHANESTQAVIANEAIDEAKLARAAVILRQLQQEVKDCIAAGSGPFLAAVYTEEGQLIARAANSVVRENCSNNHAEINAIKAAQQALGSYDLSAHNLSLYVTAEPCMMCIGGIMWSGLRAVYYGVPSRRVEEITGFDEGFKPRWFEEFAKRGICVYGNIEAAAGEEVLEDYVKSAHTIYRPERT